MLYWSFSIGPSLILVFWFFFGSWHLGFLVLSLSIIFGLNVFTKNYIGRPGFYRRELAGELCGPYCGWGD